MNEVVGECGESLEIGNANISVEPQYGLSRRSGLLLSIAVAPPTVGIAGRGQTRAKLTLGFGNLSRVASRGRASGGQKREMNAEANTALAAMHRTLQRKDVNDLAESAAVGRA